MDIEEAYRKSRKEVYDDAIDDVLEILKKNVLFPPQQSVKIFKEIKNLKSSQ